MSNETPETEFNEAEEIAYLRSTPVESILANHLFVLIQVGAFRLAESPPDLAGAQLVIDSVAGLLAAGGDRLGEHVQLYRNALAEMQQAYVRAASASSND